MVSCSFHLFFFRELDSLDSLDANGFTMVLPAPLLSADSGTIWGHLQWEEAMIPGMGPWDRAGTGADRLIA